MSNEGVYTIRNTKTGRVYVGESSDIYSRLQSHFSSLEYGNHSLALMQEEYNKYGNKYFKAEHIIEIEDVKDRLLAEITEIVRLTKANVPLYNAIDNDDEKAAKERVPGSSHLREQKFNSGTPTKTGFPKQKNFSHSDFFVARAKRTIKIITALRKEKTVGVIAEEYGVWPAEMRRALGGYASPALVRAVIVPRKRVRFAADVSPELRAELRAECELLEISSGELVGHMWQAWNESKE